MREARTEVRPAERSKLIPETTLNGKPHDFGDKHPKVIAKELRDKMGGKKKRLAELDRKEAELARVGY